MQRERVELSCLKADQRFNRAVNEVPESIGSCQSTNDAKCTRPGPVVNANLKNAVCFDPVPQRTNVRSSM